MIIDNTIDETSAKYWCLANAKQISKAVAALKDASKETSDEKAGIQTAIALGPDNKKLEECSMAESMLAEGVLASLFSSPPAWADEPTGISPVGPEDVFAGDVAGGVAGFNRGVDKAIATAGTAAFVSNPALRKLAAKVGKLYAKMFAKHPKKMAVATAAAANPEVTKKVVDVGTKVVKAGVEVAKNGAEEISAIRKMYNTVRPALAAICRFFQPAVEVMMKHPVTSAAVGAACYGLVVTRHMWIPYVKRMKYSRTSGQRLAAVKFESDGNDYMFEYRLKSKRWVLLDGMKLASKEDAASFAGTKFAQHFFAQCEKNFNALFANKDVVLSQVALMHDEELLSVMNDVIANEDVIRDTLMKQKMTF